MEKRYQVFISSTYTDLKEERHKVIQTLMEMDCIPAGMELFPAADEEQFNFIKKVIDDCDYYLIIIGGKYGSVNPEGISYTEKEFDYAIEKGLKVIAFIHEEPDKLPSEKNESADGLKLKLQNFTDKVKTDRLIKFWKTADELPGLVSLSLHKTIKMFPATGWVKANLVSNTELLTELNELRKENQKLQEIVNKQYECKIEDIADFDSNFTIETKLENNRHISKYSISISWKEIFSYIAPYLVEYPTDGYVKMKLSHFLKEYKDLYGALDINDQDFKTIGIQLKAYGLVTITYSQTIGGQMALFWGLTKKGESLMMESRVVKSDASKK